MSKEVCELCEQHVEKIEGSKYDGDFICNNCFDSLPNPTGYCSLSCRLGNGCDGAC